MTARRPELEAIRAFVVIGLVLFHSALVFDARDDFYVKNPETTGVTMIFAGLRVVWAMPMLFLIAGDRLVALAAPARAGWVRPRAAAPAGRATGVRSP